MRGYPKRMMSGKCGSIKGMCQWKEGNCEGNEGSCERNERGLGKFPANLHDNGEGRGMLHIALFPTKLPTLFTLIDEERPAP
jgi:hypothetical protein